MTDPSNFDEPEFTLQQIINVRLRGEDRAIRGVPGGVTRYLLWDLCAAGAPVNVNGQSNVYTITAQDEAIENE